MKTPEHSRRWTLSELLSELHLILTPYEDSSWEIHDRKNDRVWTSGLHLVIYNNEDGES